MSATWQLGALMKKNLILMKRSCCATFCEIFFPIILMILLVIVRRAIKIIEYNVPIVDESYLKTNSTLLISPDEIQTNSQWQGLTFRNPL
jgi:hypothetical protein